MQQQSCHVLQNTYILALKDGQLLLAPRIYAYPQHS